MLCNIKKIMKILITGANGFIGKNLTDSLKLKYKIEYPNRTQLDLLDTNAVEYYLMHNHFDIVIHAANTNNTRNFETTPYDSLSNNLRMFFNLERCRNLYGRMYYFGSGAEYDMEHYIPDMKEEYFGTYIPKDPYGFSKYVMSKTCEQNNNIYDLRLFGVYGKHEEWERRFISNAMCRALKGKNITIQKNIYFDYIWVNDLCCIMEWFVENVPSYKHYNVCRGKKIDLYSIACKIREILNIDCDIVVGETGWKKEYTGDNKRLLNEIGDFQFSGIDETIYDLYEYYRSNIDMIDETKLM